MPLLDRDRSTRIRERNEAAESRGRVTNSTTGKDMFFEGVRNVIPVTEDGRPYESGSYIKTEDGKEVRIYNGTLRYIDSGVFQGRRAAVKQREKDLMDMAEMFCDAGDDIEARQFLGVWFQFLPADGSAHLRQQLAGYLRAEGNPNPESTAAELMAVDCRPSVIRFMNPRDNAIHLAIRKMKFICSISGIVFTGEGTPQRRPDPSDMDGSYVDLGKVPVHSQPAPTGTR